MLAISQILYLGKEEKEDLHAAFLTWWGSIEKLLQDMPLKIPLQKNPNKQKPNPKQAWEHWYPYSFMGYRLYSVFLLKRTTVKTHSASVWAHTVKVVRMVSFVFAQLKGSDCVGARARNKKGSSLVHGDAVAASACDHKKRTNHRIKWEHWNFYLLPLGTTSLTLIGKTSEWAAVHCIQTWISKAPKMELDLLLNPTVSTLVWTCCILYCP